MKRDQIAALADQARALAGRVREVQLGTSSPWALEVQGMLESYFAGDKLDADLRERIRDVKGIGSLIRDSRWLTALLERGGTPSVDRAKDALTVIADVLGDAARREPDEAVAETAISAPEERVGDWRVVDRHVGEGGQGQVDLVLHVRTQERGALKRMTGPRALTEKALVRFEREIAALRRIRHPFVARILDAGMRPEPYLVTQFAALGSLKDNEDAFRGNMLRVLLLARSVADGLGAGHVAGIVHRDVKPRNILLQSLDHPLVADFGIAHFADEDTVTSVGSHPHAKYFAPPEFDDNADPTPAFDVFSLGAVIHCAFMGCQPSRPYRLLDPVPPLNGRGTASPRLRLVDDLISRMMAPDRAKRIQEMGEVVDAIDALSDKVVGYLDVPNPPTESAEPPAPSETKRAAAAPKDDQDDPWRRCGNIYWMGENLALAAYAFATDNIRMGQLELKNAAHHARQLPMSRMLFARLEALQTRSVETHEERMLAAADLVAIAGEIGRQVEVRQADFVERDVKVPGGEL